MSFCISILCRWRRSSGREPFDGVSTLLIEGGADQLLIEGGADAILLEGYQ